MCGRIYDIIENVSGRKLGFRKKHYRCEDGHHRCCEFIIRNYERNSTLFNFRTFIIFLVVCMLSVYYSELNIYIIAVTSLALLVMILTMTTTVIQESVLIEMDTVGIQQTTVNVLGQQTAEIFNKRDIKDVIINEAITMNRVIFYLAVILKDNSLKPLFCHSFPRLDCLKTIYQEMQEILNAG